MCADQCGTNLITLVLRITPATYKLYNNTFVASPHSNPLPDGLHPGASPNTYNLLLKFFLSSFLNKTSLSGYGSNTTEFNGLSSLARLNISS